MKAYDEMFDHKICYNMFLFMIVWFFSRIFFWLGEIFVDVWFDMYFLIMSFIASFLIALFLNDRYYPNFVKSNPSFSNINDGENK